MVSVCLPVLSDFLSLSSPPSAHLAPYVKAWNLAQAELALSRQSWIKAMVFIRSKFWSFAILRANTSAAPSLSNTSHCNGRSGAQCLGPSHFGTKQQQGRHTASRILGLIRRSCFARVATQDFVQSNTGILSNKSECIPVFRISTPPILPCFPPQFHHCFILRRKSSVQPPPIFFDGLHVRR